MNKTTEEKLIEEEVKRIMDSEVVKYANSKIVLEALRSGNRGYMGAKTLDTEIRESMQKILQEQHQEIRDRVRKLKKKEYYSDRGFHEMNGYNKAIKDILSTFISLKQ